jgi:hypothetical protein
MVYYKYICDGKLLGYSDHLLDDFIDGYKSPVFFIVGDFEYCSGNPFGRFIWINKGSMKMV